MFYGTKTITYWGGSMRTRASRQDPVTRLDTVTTKRQKKEEEKGRNSECVSSGAVIPDNLLK